MIYFGQDKMSEFYYGGTEIKEMYLGNTKVFQNKHPLFLTLETDGHGTLSADVLSGFEGDTVTLSPTYNTYYRFSGYDCTGGTIEGNTFTFGQEDATAKANFEVNAFTATGGWDKGSDQSVTGNKNNNYPVLNISQRYAIHGAHTGDVPASWYSTSNRWHPSNASAYEITLVPKASLYVSAYNTNSRYNNWAMTATTLIGSTQNQNQTWAAASTNTYPKTNVYSKSFTSNSQNTYSISGKLSGYGGYAGYMNINLKYVANGTTGTWTATGYAP